MLLTLIMIVLGLVAVGCVTYLAVTFIPMPENFKSAIPVIMLALCVLLIIFYIAQVAGGKPLQVFP